MNLADEDLKDLLRGIILRLRAAGIHVKVTHHKTPSLYLHLDHDVLKEIRISDHPIGKKSRHRVGYDILINQDRHRKYCAETRCFQYGLNNAPDVVEKVIIDRDHKVATMGGRNYRQLLKLAQAHPQLPHKAAAFENKLSTFLDAAPVGGGRRVRPRL